MDCLASLDSIAQVARSCHILQALLWMAVLRALTPGTEAQVPLEQRRHQDDLRRHLLVPHLAARRARHDGVDSPHACPADIQ